MRNESSGRSLLADYCRVVDELERLGITRSSNVPTGDLAEFMFCKAFGWTKTDNSTPHFDAKDAAGVRYQIKGRRENRAGDPPHLSAIRDLDGEHFDKLAAVLYSHEFDVLRAAIIPRSVVVRRSQYVKRTNSHRFILHPSVWEEPGVTDVTKRLKSLRF
jgi:hypothetical protein